MVRVFNHLKFVRQMEDVGQIPDTNFGTIKRYGRNDMKSPLSQYAIIFSRK